MAFFSALFGAKTKNQRGPAAGVNVQSSVYGRPLPVIYGTTKVAGNLILYGNFVATPTSSSTSGGGGGGKGGLFRPSSTGATQFNYKAAFAFAVCEGAIQKIGTIWQGLSQLTASALGFTVFTGTYPQTAWGTTVSWSVTDANGVVTSGTSTALDYNGVAYLAASTYDLGTSTSIPNLQYEVYGVYSSSVSGQKDADPSLIVNDVLTNTHYGAGYPSAYVGSLTNYQNYTLAAGLLLSPAYTTQRTVADVIDEIMSVTNSACFFSSGLFQVTPYGDQTLTGNGKTYTPPSSPQYALTDSDFMSAPQNNTGNSGSGSGSGPVLMARKRKSDRINSVKLEYLDRSNAYNPAVAYAENQAEIDTYGKRTNGSKQLHLLCNATAANLSANLQLRRELITNTYQFDLDQRYILLDPMDIVSITDSALGLNAQWVRITEIIENDDGTLSFTAEEYLAGTGGAPAYSFASQQGQPIVNFEAAPGALNTPVFFEPPYALAGELAVFGAISATSNWGGADVWVSTDGTNYQFSQRITGGARMGTLTASLANYAAATTGATIDQTNTLSVDLTESTGSLTSASQANAIDLATLCYVDGELIAYATATLTAASKYNLTYLVRGAYSSTISSHANGSNFVRLDNGVFKIPFTQDRVGQTIYVKFLSFNQYGGGQITLANATAYSYKIQGTALAASLPNITNLAEVFVGNIAELSWTEVSDFRVVLYEIRVGASWANGQFLVRQAHPPFRVMGDGTYWVAAYSQPLPNLTVYSATPQSLQVIGANVTANIIATREEDPTFSGTLSGAVVKVGNTIQSNGTGGGYYQIPSADRITITYPFACSVIMKWTSTGQPLNNSIFTYKGVANLTSGSATVSGLQIYNGNALLNGTATLTGISNTTGMGAGQPITGTGISSGAEVLSVVSSVSITMTVAATTGSTSSLSTQAIVVYPALAANLVFQTTSTAVIPSGVTITAVSTTNLDTVTLSTTSLATSTTTVVQVSIDWPQTPDLFGAAAISNTTILPQLRTSQDGGVTWGNWQQWFPGYYKGSGFDARMLIQTNDVNSVAVLDTWAFKVDVPDRIDHYTGYSVSTGGSTLTFRPDASVTSTTVSGSTAGFNGGQNASTQVTVLTAFSTGLSFGNIQISNISLNSCVLNCYSSLGLAVAANLNVVVEGY